MINKVFDEKYNFWKLTCDDTEVISSWNEGEDIISYSSFKIAYCPKDADLDVYHTFTAEQDVEYTKQREEEERKRHPEPEVKENKENE